MKTRGIPYSPAIETGREKTLAKMWELLRRNLLFTGHMEKASWRFRDPGKDLFERITSESDRRSMALYSCLLQWASNRDGSKSCDSYTLFFLNNTRTGGPISPGVAYYIDKGIDEIPRIFNSMSWRDLPEGCRIDVRHLFRDEKSVTTTTSPSDIRMHKTKVLNTVSEEVYMASCHLDQEEIRMHHFEDDPSFELNIKEDLDAFARQSYNNVEFPEFCDRLEHKRETSQNSKNALSDKIWWGNIVNSIESLPDSYGFLIEHVNFFGINAPEKKEIKKRFNDWLNSTISNISAYTTRGFLGSDAEWNRLVCLEWARNRTSNLRLLHLAAVVYRNEFNRKVVEKEELDGLLEAFNSTGYDRGALESSVNIWIGHFEKVKEIFDPKKEESWTSMIFPRLPEVVFP